ncbi:hypothetical protein [Micromonospora sp. NPDC048063]|uniref:hypothetical protein n=1 Tax=Micromonospora sp. NPDC048063 TaxID=3364256 RepID=UPI003721DFA8
MDLVRLRYLGDARVRVPKLGRVVEPDELVGVPRDVYERYAWPEAQWRREDGDQDRPQDGGGPSAPQEGAGDQQQAPAEAAGSRSRKAGGRDA